MQTRNGPASEPEKHFYLTALLSPSVLPLTISLPLLPLLLPLTQTMPPLLTKCSPRFLAAPNGTELFSSFI